MNESSSICTLTTDHFTGEYEEAKNYEFFRRYTKLKGVIKRCVMYTKLGTLPDVTCAISMGGVMMIGAGINRYQRSKHVISHVYYLFH